jgi:hypothetical protein
MAVTGTEVGSAAADIFDAIFVAIQVKDSIPTDDAGQEAFFEEMIEEFDERTGIIDQIVEELNLLPDSTERALLDIVFKTGLPKAIAALLKDMEED